MQVDGQTVREIERNLDGWENPKVLSFTLVIDCEIQYMFVYFIFLRVASVPSFSGLNSRDGVTVSLFLSQDTGLFVGARVLCKVIVLWF